MEERLAILLELYSKGMASAVEQEELMEAIRIGEYDQFVESYMRRSWEKPEPLISLTKEQDQKILGHIFKNSKVYSLASKQRTIYRWIAAASVILVIAFAWFLFPVNRKQAPASLTVGILKDVDAPQSTRAVITLGDGRQIFLDSSGKGVLAMQDNVAVVRNGLGGIEYQLSVKSPETAVGYNTMFNPRGSQVIPLTLSDGTKVWLNCASSIKFPTVFTGKNRIVEITGEAYFEVRHNPSKPFKVLVNDMEVAVLGTHFNINSYKDDGAIKTTLLEGKVEVSRKGDKVVLKPGEQAVTSANSTLTVDHLSDVSEVMAWKNGMFEFNNTELPEILAQVSRWYDVDIVYESKSKKGALGGGISRRLPLSKVLKLLEVNGARFKSDGKKLIVL